MPILLTTSAQELPGYRPAFEEIADEAIASYYRNAGADLIKSRESSEYLRGIFLKIKAERQLTCLTHEALGSVAPSQASVRNSKDVLEELFEDSLYPDALVRSAEGGIAICFARNGKYADIECSNSGEITAVRYSEQDDPFAWDVQNSQTGIRSTIRNISQYFSE